MSVIEEEEKSIQQMSIRARQVVGAICLWNFCKRFDIGRAEIEPLVEHLFKLATVSTPEELGTWEQKGPALFRFEHGDPLPPTLELILPEKLKPAFLAMLEDVIEIGCCDLYGATTDGSKIHLQKVISVLRQLGVPVPSLDKFTVSSFAEMNGWGKPVSPELENEWRLVLNQHN